MFVTRGDEGEHAHTEGLEGGEGLPEGCGRENLHHEGC